MSDPKRVDLLAARRARAEKRTADGTSTEVVIVVGDVEARPPAEMPLESLEVMGSMLTTKDMQGLGGTMAAIFGAEVWEAMRAEFTKDGAPISLDDALELLGSVMDAYGLEAPESPASSAP